ncbi:hypothetical protein F5Y19DRAFT_493590 [Xylariaceae sp. FL1651]|nr:hypothetical protein F5Y19DRAFT_493590 [Xylariaceae sp. FL1651]
MSDAALYISNGDCYYGEGQISDSRFIPCGNAAVAGTQACCFEGDFCLASNVCYDNDTSVTYITGCTDATFSSSKCPHKAGYPDQQWVALARCDGDDIDLFSGCGHHKDEIEIKHEDCTCDAASALISNPIHGQPTLNQIGLLPTTAGGTISFNPTSLPTATGSPSHSGSGGLSTGAKAGIGVGIGVGVPVIAAIIFIFIFLGRKKKRKQQEKYQEQQPQQPQQPPSELPPQQEAHDQVPRMPHSPPPMYSPDSENAHSGWLRYKPELHADSTHKFELPADMSSQSHKEITRNSIQQTPHESYPPSRLLSEYADGQRGTRSILPISPQRTGSTDASQSGAVGGHHGTGSSSMQPLSEYNLGRSL